MKFEIFSLVEFHDIDLSPQLCYNNSRSSTILNGSEKEQISMIVCFIGHRTVNNAEQVKIKLIDAISSLIAEGADTFLFGSRSEFDSLCWEAVTALKEKYPHIKRVCYTAPHEVVFTSKEEREQCEQFFSQMIKHEVHYTDYEEAINSQKAIKANKNAYIMRNQEMIDASDVCVFYYNKDYKPPIRKSSNKFLPDYQPKSGTAITKSVKSSPSIYNFVPS